MRTFVCIVPETGCRVTTDNGEPQQRKEWLCDGRSIRLFHRRPSAILSHEGQKSHVTIAQAEGLGMRLLSSPKLMRVT